MVPLLQPHSSSSGGISDTSFLPDSRLSSGLLCSSLPVGPPLFPSDDRFHLPSTYPMPGSVLNSLLRVHVQPYLVKTIMSPFYRWENGGTKMLTCSRSLSKKILTFSAYWVFAGCWRKKISVLVSLLVGGLPLWDGQGLSLHWFILCVLSFRVGMRHGLWVFYVHSILPSHWSPWALAP